MKKHLLLALSVVALIGVAIAQASFPWYVMQVFSPPGSCTNNAPPEQYSGVIYVCNGTNYAGVGTGNVTVNTAFSSITNGVSTNKTLLVGNGSGLTFIGTGFIQATLAGTATNLGGSSVYSAPYQSSTGITSYITPAFTDFHTYLYGWQTTVEPVAPAAIDLAGIFAAPPPYGITNPQAVDGTTITATLGFAGPGTGLTGTASGLSIGGNAATATALTTSPSPCAGGTAVVAIANGTAITCSGITSLLGYTPLNPSNNLADVLSTSTALSNLGGVPTSRTINTHALTSNVVISASDLTTGTLPHAQLPTLLSGDIPNNAANTSGTSANLSGTPALPNGTTATTQGTCDSSTKLATGAAVVACISASGGGTVSSASNTTVVNDIVTYSNPSGTIIKDSGYVLPAGAVVGISDSQTITNKNMTSATNSWPTFNQSTTGQAGTALALAAAPTVCSAGQAPTGIAANGNAQGCTAYVVPSGTVVKVASGTITISSASIAVGACQVFTQTATGALTSDSLSFGANVDLTGVAGFAPTGPTVQIYLPWLTANTLNVKLCNPYSNPSTITTGSFTLPFIVTR